MTTQPMGSGASTGTATSWKARPSSTSMAGVRAVPLARVSCRKFERMRCGRGRSVSDDHRAVEIDEHHGVGADARAVIGEHRGDGAGVVRGDGFAEREVGGQHARGKLELLGVLLEQAREHALTDVEFFFDLGVRIARIGGVDEPERRDLHQRQQCDEEDDDAGLEALDAHHDTAGQRQSHEGPRITLGNRPKLSWVWGSRPLKRLTSSRNHAGRLPQSGSVTPIPL